MPVTSGGKACRPPYEPARPRVPYELTPTNIPGAYVSPAIPEDFDPDAASPTALIKHGLLWRRPAADARPAHRAVWERAFTSQSPAPDTIVYQGSTVEMHLSDHP